MTTSQSASRRTSFCFGSLPLCLSVEGPEDVRLVQKFEGLLLRIKEKLETFANTKILKFEEKNDGLSVRLPRLWSPAGIDGELEPGYWAFPEFFSPIVFRFHLPKKIQNNYYPVGDEDGVSEDFTVVYDGMTFTAAASSNQTRGRIWTAPMIREYLKKDLLAGIADYKAVTIPPCPLHVQIELISHEAATDADRKPGHDEYHPMMTNIVMERWDKEVPPIEELAEYFHRKLRLPIRQFYHLMLDKNVVDEAYHEIRGTSEEIFEDYFELLQAGWWSLIKRAKAKRNLSVSLAALQREFCNHSVAVAELEEGREALKRELLQHHPLSLAGEYFEQMGKPDQVNYEVFHSTLEHVRSHLLVLVQNRYLILAAIVGALITLLATYLPRVLMSAPDIGP